MSLPHTAFPQACPRPASFYLNPQSPSQAARTLRRTSATFRPSPLAGPVLSFDSLPLANSSSRIREDGLTDVEQGSTPTSQAVRRSASEDVSAFERCQLQVGTGHAPIVRVSSSPDLDAESSGSHSSDSAAVEFLPPLPVTVRKASSSSLSSHKERDLRRLSLTASLSPSSLFSMQSVSRSISTSSRLSNPTIPELSPTSPSNASLSVPDQLRPRRRSTLAASSPSVSKQRSSASLAELAQEELERGGFSTRRRSSVLFSYGVEDSSKATGSGSKGTDAPNDRHNWFTAEPIPVFSRSAIKTQGIVMPVAASSLDGLTRSRSSTSLSSSLDSTPATRPPSAPKTIATPASERRDKQLSEPRQLNEKKVKRRASLGFELKRSISRKFTLSLSNAVPSSVSRTSPVPVPMLPAILAYSKADASSKSALHSILRKGDAKGDSKANANGICADFEANLGHTVEVHVTPASSTSSNSSRTPSVDISPATPSSIRRAWKIVRSRSRKRSLTMPMPQECGEKGASGVKRRPSASSKKKTKRFPLVRTWS